MFKFEMHFFRSLPQSSILLRLVCLDTPKYIKPVSSMEVNVYHQNKIISPTEVSWDFLCKSILLSQYFYNLETICKIIYVARNPSW